MATAGIARTRIRFVGSKTKRSIVSCNECRRRKKRCDEKRPQCGACTKRRVECLYQRDRKDDESEQEEQQKKVKCSDGGDSGKKEDPENAVIGNHNNDDDQNKIEEVVGIMPRQSLLDEPVDELGNQILVVAKGGTGAETGVGEMVSVSSPGWYNRYTLFSPADSNEFQSLDPMSFTRGGNGGSGGSSRNSVSSGLGPDISVNINFDPPLDSMHGFGNISMNLEMDLDSLAKSIIGSFDAMSFKEKPQTTLGRGTDKFLKSCSLLLPLAYRSRPILMALCAWILSMNGDIQTSQFLDESLMICDRLEFKIDYSGEWDEDDLIDYIVSLTCLTIISTINGDTGLWKLSFERLYTGLRKVGLDMLLVMIKKQENKNVFLWAINWFFYQDVFKMIKVTSKRLLGPLFSKKEYMKFITNGASESVSTNDIRGLTASPPTLTASASRSSGATASSNKDFLLKKFFDKSISCCMNLYVALGEINALYDQFSIKIQSPILVYYKHVEPVMRELTEEEKLEFVHSDVYLEYEAIRYDFHSWVQEKTALLEKRVQECSIINEGFGPIEEEMVVYFKVMKLSVLLYLKFKLQELSATSYEVKQIVLNIFEKMRFLLKVANGRFNSGQLLFPLLIIGANVCEVRDRIMIKSFYVKMRRSMGTNTKNLELVWTIIQEFWRLNPDGLSFEMWQNILNKYDWNVCVI